MIIFRFKRKLVTGTAEILTALSAFGTAILEYYDDGSSGTKHKLTELSELHSCSYQNKTPGVTAENCR